MGGLTAFDRILGSGEGPDENVEVPERSAEDEK